MLHVEFDALLLASAALKLDGQRVKGSLVDAYVTRCMFKVFVHKVFFNGHGWII